MILPLDGPGVYGSLSVSTSAVEVKVNASALGERKIVGMQPLNGDIFVGFDSSVTVGNGIKIFKGQYVELERGESLAVFAIAAATTDVRITEIG